MVWIFVMLLQLPSFGGEVTVTVRAQTWDGCMSLRRLVVNQLGGEGNIRGTITRCTVAAPPAAPEPSPEPDPPPTTIRP